MRHLLIAIFALMMTYPNVSKSQTSQNLIAVLDTIWCTEQTPLTLRDLLRHIYGEDLEQFREQQEIYKKTH